MCHSQLLFADHSTVRFEVIPSHGDAELTDRHKLLSFGGFSAFC